MGSRLHGGVSSPVDGAGRRPLLDLIEVLVEAREWSDVPGVWGERAGRRYRGEPSRGPRPDAALTFARPPPEVDVVDGDVAA